MLCSHLHLDLTVGGAFKNYRFTSCMNFSSHWCFVHVSVYNTLLEPVSFIIHIPRGRHTQQTWPDQIRSDQTRTDQTRPEQIRPDQTRPDHQTDRKSTFSQPESNRSNWNQCGAAFLSTWTCTGLHHWQQSYDDGDDTQSVAFHLNLYKDWKSDLSDMSHSYSVSVYVVDNPQLVINFIIKLWKLRYNRYFRRLYCLHLQELTFFLYLWSRWCHWNFLST
jgi:hypothetical protein